MNLKIKIDEQIIKLHEGSFNQEETCIIFETSDSEDEKYKVDYNLEIKSTFEEADYLIYFFITIILLKMIFIKYTKILLVQE